MVTFEVAFLPGESVRRQRGVFILVDVLRATSSIAHLLDRGCRTVVLAGDTAGILAVRQVQLDVLVCAENADGSRLAEADISPSLRELDKAEVAGKTVVLLTTNGTLAAQSLQGRSGLCITGSLRNAHAAMRAATSAAREVDLPITIVCSGREGSQVYAFDDVYCAGFLVREGVELLDASGTPMLIRDSAKLALDVLGAHPDPDEALRGSESAAVLRRIGCDEDITIAASPNISNAVPVIAMDARFNRLSARPATQLAAIQNSVS
jgi:phosphosulfolactate phosphohydrolase-like enzyme